MSVFREKDRKCYRYKFEFKGKTHKGSTGQITQEDAEAFELKLKVKLHRQAGGLIDLRDAPPFAEWAGVYYEFKSTSGPQNRPVERPERIDEQAQMVLRFFGRRPSDPSKVDANAPYHDLTLADPILDPEWLDKFETWMASRGIAGSTMNHYRSTVSGMFRVAMIPRYRKVTGVTMNPMDGVLRDRHVSRDVTLEPEEIVSLIRVSSYHVRLAISIAALASKLRLQNVLGLEWGVHLDRELTRITVTRHKTAQQTRRPLVVFISEQLRDILEDARRRNLGRWVISYRSRRVKSIRGGVAAAAKRAGIHYGLRDGATFHTIRHAVATWFAEMEGLTEPQRAALLAHANIATTQRYTHLRPVKELPHLERLSALLPIAELVKQPWRRWSEPREESGTTGGPTAQISEGSEDERSRSRLVVK